MKRYMRLMLCVGSLCLLIACAEDEGPSINDHFLNYEIPDVPLTADCPVGVFYYNTKEGLDDAIYNRLSSLEPGASATAPNVGPGIKPVLGNYKGISSNKSSYSDMVEIAQHHVDWCIEGGVDFLILPAANEHRWNIYPKNVQAADTLFYNIISGRWAADGRPAKESSAPHVDMHGKLKFAMSVNLNGINSVNNLRLSQTHRIEDKEKPIYKENNTKEVTRIQMFNDLFKRVSDYFNEPNYYCVDGKPLVVLINADGLYSADSKKLYDDMRAYVKEHTGKDMFLVAQQNCWTPPARYQYFYINGGVDALTHKNMYFQSLFERSYFYPQAIDQNWQYSRNYLMDNWGIDYIPTGSPSFNYNVHDGTRYNMPIVKRDMSTFKTMCNVMKRNLGKRRIVFIDSFNQFNYDSFIEPTDPTYGNGYGMDYLYMIKEQFEKTDR